MASSNNLIKRSSFWANLFKSPTEKSDLENVLKSMPPFCELNKKYIKALIKIVHNRAFTKDEFIFLQGDPGIGLYVIQSGSVVIRQNTGDNNTIDLATFNRGDFFGELALMDDEIRSASAIALSDSEIGVIFKPDLDEFVEKYPDIGIKILRGIAHIITKRLHRLNDDYLTLYIKTFNNNSENVDV
ncbi:MAG: Crp/Fnr family transcriptional regulator [Melioribacteraceae bacterium]|nr:Crp/Fnr family transcriptional regulator [Melioribacteraceae bacterium]MCF8353451.1 Crp/Fnr family transcriptional regulator [Melioribacteraceae bacterium]MCF8393939.1 Crp/Fnr family transcriptional regulator [Melioribacteraceae bacterium]MCF8419012.1 Crp/Fnr family transcriptional regulator [Melioribacteraceae bacterium]